MLVNNVLTDTEECIVISLDLRKWLIDFCAFLQNPLSILLLHLSLLFLFICFSSIWHHFFIRILGLVEIFLDWVVDKNLFRDLKQRSFRYIKETEMHWTNNINLVKKETSRSLACRWGTKNEMHIVHNDLLHGTLKFIFNFLIEIDVLFFFNTTIYFRLLVKGTVLSGSINFIQHLPHDFQHFTFDFFPGLPFQVIIIMVLV